MDQHCEEKLIEALSTEQTLLPPVSFLFNTGSSAPGVSGGENCAYFREASFIAQP